MDKLEEAARKAKEAAKSVADVLDTSNAKLICTLLSVAFDTALRELEIQLRREELSTPWTACPVQSLQKQFRWRPMQPDQIVHIMTNVASMMYIRGRGRQWCVTWNATSCWSR